MIGGNNNLNSARAVVENNKQIEAEERSQSEKRIYEQKVANSELVKQLERQNEISQEQNILLKEENERQKQQIKYMAEKESEWRKSSKKAKIYNWLAYGTATLLSVVAIIIAIVK